MAIEFDKPSNLDVIWASAGDILNPGDTKYSTGWAVEIPPRQWENYIQNKQDQAIAHFNQHGVSVWDNVSQYLASKSYVQGPTTGAIYRAKQDNVGQNPELDTAHTYWGIAFASSGDFYSKTDADATFLKKANNLSEVNAVTARTNLNVYSKSETYTKTEVDAKTAVASTAQAQSATSNVVLMTPLRTKEYADANFLKIANNLSDLADLPTARNNLNVYSKAETYTKTEVDAKTTVASTPQAQAGVSNVVLMTPLRTKEYANANLLGMSQTWQDVKASRVANTVYTNTTGKPIMVNVMVTGNDANTLYVNGVSVGVINGEGSVGSCISAVVPNGSTYNTNFNPSIWAELR